MLHVQHAETGSKGTLADVIGWIDFGTQLRLTKDNRTATVTNSLPGEFTISFDISLDINEDSRSCSKIIYKGVTTPTFRCAPFGTTAYTGIPGRVALYMPSEPEFNGQATVTLTLDNIRLTAENGRPISNFFMIAADAGVTNRSTKTWSVEATPNPWDLLFTLPSVCKHKTCSPVVTNLFTLKVLERGNDTELCETASNAFITLSPTRIIAQAELDDDRAGFAFGIVIPREAADFVSDTQAISPRDINRVREDTTVLFRLPICSPDVITSITHNGIMHPFNSQPLVIVGNLGTYLFFRQKVLFIANTTIPNPQFDTFILRTAQDDNIVISFASC